MQNGNNSNAMLLSMICLLSSFEGCSKLNDEPTVSKNWTQLPNSYNKSTHLQERIFIKLNMWQETFNSLNGLKSAENW